MPVTRMGFEGQAFYGVAGAIGANQLTNSRDINYVMETEEGDTTPRGDGSSPPIGGSRVTRRNYSMEITMLNRPTDTSLAAMLTAAYGGSPVALRLKDNAAGKGYDGDVNLTVTNGLPIQGEQTYVFTASPNRELREPQPYV